jgi:hypothetical protein
VVVSSDNDHGNFGCSVKFKKDGSPAGQSIYTFRGADGYDYVIKSNSWQGGGLAITSNTAAFAGKATVTVIDPKPGLAVPNMGGGGYSFRADATDTKTGDTYALTVYTANGALYHRAGTTTAQIPLGGGNIAIHG